MAESKPFRLEDALPFLYRRHPWHGIAIGDDALAHAHVVPIEPARGAEPHWEGEQVIGARRRGGEVVSAREVVLASGLKTGRFWRLPRPATDLGRRALLRADPQARRGRAVLERQRAVHVAAAALQRGRDGVQRGALDRGVVVFGYDEDGHVRSPWLRS